MKTHKYHRENCDTCIRETFIDIYGRTIYLSGTHAFEYTISIISITGNIQTTTYKNGREARKELRKYKLKK